jgi:hypothetical protein
MPEEKTDAEKEAEAKAAADKKAADEAAAAETAAAEKEQWSEERAKATILKQRESETALKAKLKDAEAKAKKLDELEAAQLSEQEKLAKQAEEAIAKAADADSKLQRANLIAALANPELGIVNARAAAKLIEGVEYDDNGEPTNLGAPGEDDSLVAKFLIENDYLRGKPGKPKPPSTDAREGGDDTPPDLNAEELAAAKAADMTPEEYAAYKDGGSLADLKERGLVTDLATT